MEKASFDRLNRLFEIAAGERSCETLLSAQNLRLVTQVSQPYVLNILPRRLPKKVVAGEHFILKDLPFYTAMRKADAQARKARLNVREVKRQEGTLQKAPGDKRLAFPPPAGAPAKKKKKKVLNKGKKIKLPTPPKEVVIPSPTFVKGIIIRMPDPSVLPSVSNSSGHIACLNGSGPSVPAARRLALLAEEANLVNQPGSPHPDADVVGASCTETLSHMTPLTEQTGVESQGLPPCEPSSLALVPVKGPATRRSRPACDLKSASSGGFRIVFWKPSKSTAHPSKRIIQRGVRRRWQKRTQPPRCWSRMRVHPKRSSRP